MNKIVEVKILENYIVLLKFNDGYSSEIDLEPFLGKGIAKELLAKDKFGTLDLESGGGIAFSNGFDFCPNYLRMLVDKRKEVQKVV